MSSSSSGASLESFKITLEEIILATDNFSKQNYIGGGGFGCVYRGTLRRNRKAAIKRLDPSGFQGKGEFLNELALLSGLHHENIITFIGYCDENNEMFIAYDYAGNQSLDHHLRDTAKMGRITWAQRLKICIGAAKGLNYLHSGLGSGHRIIHRDVKSANILLDANLEAKICDFGLSRLGLRNQPFTQFYTAAAGTAHYCDPYYVATNTLTKESDVYSLGVVMFEILCGRLVYARNVASPSLLHFVQENGVDQIIDPSIRDEIPRKSLQIFKEVAYQCIQYNFKERPLLVTVIVKLEQALNPQFSFSQTVECAQTAIGLLIEKLTAGDSDEQRAAAGEMRLFTKRNAANRARLADAGAIPLLVELLPSGDGQTQEHAITALLNLSINDANKGIIMSVVGSIPNILQVLKNGSRTDARENAAATIFSLSVVEENRVAIGAAGAIPPLIDLLQEGTLRGKRDAISAIFNLLIYRGNRGRAIRAGIMALLMRLIKDVNGGLMDEGLAVLAILATDQERKAAISEADPIPTLVEVMRTGSPQNRENGSAILQFLCVHDVECLKMAKELGAEEVVKELSGEGTKRAKRKAVSLLKMLDKLTLTSL